MIDVHPWKKYVLCIEVLLLKYLCLAIMNQILAK